MIVVLDTNVIVSSVLSPTGRPAEIIRRWEANEFDLATSQPLIAELENVLTYQRVSKYFKEPEEKVITLLRRLRTVATAVEPQSTLDVVKQDPPDNRVLECAVGGGASYIVSGDRHLLDLKEYQGIVILNPAGFLAALALEKGERR